MNIRDRMTEPEVTDSWDARAAAELEATRKQLEAMEQREAKVPNPHQVQHHPLDPNEKHRATDEAALEQLREQRRQWEQAP